MEVVDIDKGNVQGHETSDVTSLGFGKLR